MCRNKKKYLEKNYMEHLNLGLVRITYSGNEQILLTASSWSSLIVTASHTTCSELDHMDFSHKNFIVSKIILVFSLVCSFPESMDLEFMFCKPTFPNVHFHRLKSSFFNLSFFLFSFFPLFLYFAFFISLFLSFFLFCNYLFHIWSGTRSQTYYGSNTSQSCSLSFL